MRGSSAYALVLLVFLSASAFAVSPAGVYTNSTFINARTSNASGIGVVNGLLYFSDNTFQRPDQGWTSNPVTGTIDAITPGFSHSENVGPIPFVTLKFYYLAKGSAPNPDYWLLLGTNLTDANGRFEHTLKDVNFNNIPDPKCARIRIEYSPLNNDPPTLGETQFCRDTYLSFAAVNLADCFPVFVVLGLLIGAMYASGNDPLRTFDITTPRLPFAKRKPMAGTTMYVPGWTLQRKGTLLAMKLTGKRLRKSYDNLEKSMSEFSRTRPTTETGRILLAAYRQDGNLMRSIWSSRGLRDTQKMILIEALYLGQGNMINRLTGNSKRDLEAIMSRNNGRELRALSRRMDERLNKEAVGVRQELRDTVRKYDKKMAGAPSQRGAEPRAWSYFTEISGAGENPGFRYLKETAENNFITGLKWMKLDNPVGRFMARTPGLSGGVTTAIGSVNLITGIYGRTLRTAALETVGQTLRVADKGGTVPIIKAKLPGLGSVVPAVSRANEAFASRRRWNQGNEQVASIGNGFVEQAKELRSILAELQDRRRITPEQANRIKQKISVLESRSNSSVSDAEKIKSDARLSNSEKRAQLDPINNRLKAIQGEFTRLYDGNEFRLSKSIRGHVEDLLREQRSADAKRATGGRGNLDDYFLERTGKIILDRMNKESSKVTGSGRARVFRPDEIRDDAERVRIDGTDRAERARLKRQLSSAETALTTAAKAWESSKTQANRNAYGQALNTYSKILDGLHTGADPAAAKTALTMFERIVKENGVIVLDNASFRRAIRRVGEKIESGASEVNLAAKHISTLKEADGTGRRTGARAGLPGGQPVLDDRELETKILRLNNAYSSSRGHLNAFSERYSLDKNNMAFKGLTYFDGSRKPSGELAEMLMREHGEVGLSAISMINRALSMEKSFGRTKPKDSIIPKAEMDRMRELIRGSAGEAGSVFERFVKETEVSVSHAQRRELTGKIKTLIEKGDTGQIERMFDFVSNKKWVEEGLMSKYFGTGVRLTQNDLMNKTELRRKYDSIMTDPALQNSEVRAQRLTNLMVESFPWYRKRRTENLDYFVRYISDPLKGTDYRAVNIMDAERRLNSWKYANDEVLSRGLIPGARLTHDESIRAGAWVAQPEGYWLPITATKQRSESDVAYSARRRGIETYIQPYTGQMDRLIYAQRNGEGRLENLSEDRRTDNRALGAIFEKSAMAGLYSVGVGSVRARYSAPLSYYGIDDARAYYENQWMTRRGLDASFGGDSFRVDELRDRYLRLVQARDKQALGRFDDTLRQHNSDLEAARASNNQAEVRRLKEEIKTRNRELKEEIKYLESTLVGFSPTLRMRDDFRRALHLPEGQRGEHEITGHEGFQRDPELDKIMRELGLASYTMNFLGIVPVRSGRATSSTQDEFGIIATGQGVASPGIMERRKHNWVRGEWSEMDLPQVIYPGYGHLLRAFITPGIQVAQRISATERPATLEMAGLPGNWEPQYFGHSNKPHAGLLTGATILGTIPFSPTAGFMANPARDGWFDRTALGQALHTSSIKYRAYQLTSSIDIPIPLTHGDSISFRNLGMLGHDLDGFRAGGPMHRMAFIDKTYTPGFSGGYQPVFYKDPYGKTRQFPAFERGIRTNFPGLAVDRDRWQMNDDIFRRETTALDNLVEREKPMPGGWRKLFYDHTSVSIPLNIADGIKGKVTEIATSGKRNNEEKQKWNEFKQTMPTSAPLWDFQQDGRYARDIRREEENTRYGRLTRSTQENFTEKEERLRQERARRNAEKAREQTQPLERIAEPGPDRAEAARQLASERLKAEKLVERQRAETAAERERAMKLVERQREADRKRGEEQIERRELTEEQRKRAEKLVERQRAETAAERERAMQLVERQREADRREAEKKDSKKKKD